jgi:SAM-dependent methyltransferase
LKIQELRMPDPPSFSDTGRVKRQYHDAGNLKARIRLHEQCSTNQYGWQRWLFDHVEFPPGGSVLELGCGAGNFWLDNAQRIPPGLNLVLSDLFAGMLEQARNNIHWVFRDLDYADIDAQSLPFDDHIFEVVIANHMLFHVPDRRKALGEIRHVLKPGGHFYASITGENHLKELADLLAGFNSQLYYIGRLPPGSFTLESGCDELHDFFSHIVVDRYPDSLLVNDAGLLADYVISGMAAFSTLERDQLVNFIVNALTANGGKLHIFKDSGLFEAWN